MMNSLYRMQGPSRDGANQKYHCRFKQLHTQHVLGSVITGCGFVGMGVTTCCLPLSYYASMAIKASKIRNASTRRNSSASAAGLSKNT